MGGKCGGFCGTLVANLKASFGRFNAQLFDIFYDLTSKCDETTEIFQFFLFSIFS